MGNTLCILPVDETPVELMQATGMVEIADGSCCQQRLIGQALDHPTKAPDTGADADHQIGLRTAQQPDFSRHPACMLVDPGDTGTQVFRTVPVIGKRETYTNMMTENYQALKSPARQRLSDESA